MNIDNAVFYALAAILFISLVLHAVGAKERKSAQDKAKEIERLRSALAELVALKDIKDELSLLLPREEGGAGSDYDRRKPLAWKAAREALKTPNK